ncbi:PleD family two-component system response regulator [Rhodospirillaceae bacterium SYSU D60014]|uniref:PleD family two-component system response regulator n=1 Tax=Virgifigura deserti TaxID=2268457 RepID=UPI000E66F732
MSARVLVVDDIPANVRLLEAKLTAEYFDVVTAASGKAALDIISASPPDIILLDVMMPQMDGFEVCARIKGDPRTAHLPVVMVTALSDSSDRVRGLEAGADDFLTKPVNDLALFARVRSLVRLKMIMDEWRLREETCGQFELLSTTAALDADDGRNARILIVEQNATVADKIVETLATAGHRTTVIESGGEALDRSRQEQFDLIGVSLTSDSDDRLRLCSQLRSQDETRQVPILLIVDDWDTNRLIKGLDIGANDYLVKPIDRNELIARVRTQVRRRRYQDRLRANYERSLSLALTDSLTGLYNRRYMTRHLEGLVQRMRESGKPLSIMLFDIDGFKSINDTYGHAVGDEILRHIAQRVAGNMRNFDMVARFGGEEFVVLMPDTPGDVAFSVAERLRERIGGEPFAVAGCPHPLDVTVSIGIAAASRLDAPDDLLKRADAAMYQAKTGGRNRTVAGDAPTRDRPPMAEATQPAR